MNKYKLAAAFVTSMALSSAVYATNNLETTVDVTAYIAAGLTADMKAMVFGAVVAPTSNAPSPSTVTIECDGAVSYSQNASPSGVGNTTQNAGDAAPATPGAGELTISGESNYAISVSIASGLTPTGVTFKPEIRTASNCNGTEDLSQLQLSGGELVMSVFGELEVTPDFDTTGNQAVTTTAVVTVSYR